MFSYSEDITNNYWGTTNNPGVPTREKDVTIAPDGSNTGNKLTQNSGATNMDLNNIIFKLTHFQKKFNILVILYRILIVINNTKQNQDDDTVETAENLIKGSSLWKKAEVKKLLEELRIYIKAFQMKKSDFKSSSDKEKLVNFKEDTIIFKNDIESNVDDDIFLGVLCTPSDENQYHKELNILSNFTTHYDPKNNFFSDDENSPKNKNKRKSVLNSSPFGLNIDNIIQMFNQICLICYKFLGKDDFDVAPIKSPSSSRTPFQRKWSYYLLLFFYTMYYPIIINKTLIPKIIIMINNVMDKMYWVQLDRMNEIVLEYKFWVNNVINGSKNTKLVQYFNHK